MAKLLKGRVSSTIEAEPTGHGPWMTYKKIEVNPEKIVNFIFPDSFQSRWIRFISDTDCIATAWLKNE